MEEILHHWYVKSHVNCGNSWKKRTETSLPSSVKLPFFLGAWAKCIGVLASWSCYDKNVCCTCFLQFFEMWWPPAHERNAVSNRINNGTTYQLVQDFFHQQYVRWRKVYVSRLGLGTLVRFTLWLIPWSSLSLLFTILIIVLSTTFRQYHDHNADCTPFVARSIVAMWPWFEFLLPFLGGSFLLVSLCVERGSSDGEGEESDFDIEMDPQLQHTV